jgi:hypothetical protein
LSLAKCGRPLQRVRDKRRTTREETRRGNLKRRHVNNFQRTELASKAKPIPEEMGKPNSGSNLVKVSRLNPHY